MPQSRPEVTVLIADDHALVRRWLRVLLQHGEIRLVGEAENGEEAVRLCDRLRPDIVLLDISMPVLDGFAAARKIRALSPETKIIFLTSHPLQEYVSEALRAGCHGYVLKDHAAHDLLTAIEAVMDGEIVVPFSSNVRPPGTHLLSPVVTCPGS